MLLITAAQLYAAQLEAALGRKKRDFLSFSAGVAIGYVFVYLLPKLGDYTATILATEKIQSDTVLYRVWFIALGGFVFYYIINWFSVVDHRFTQHLTVLHAGAFTTYSFMVGNLLADLPWSEQILPYPIVGLVFVFHFFGITHQLRQWHPEEFERYIRWLLALSVAAGWLVGIVIPLPKSVTIAVAGFVAGAIVTNVMMEELPRHETGRLGPFLAGVGFLVLAAVILDIAAPLHDPA